MYYAAEQVHGSGVLPRLCLRVCFPSHGWVNDSGRTTASLLASSAGKAIIIAIVLNRCFFSFTTRWTVRGLTHISNSNISYGGSTHTTVEFEYLLCLGLCMYLFVNSKCATTYTLSLIQQFNHQVSNPWVWSEQKLWFSLNCVSAICRTEGRAGLLWVCIVLDQGCDCRNESCCNYSTTGTGWAIPWRRGAVVICILRLFLNCPPQNARMRSHFRFTTVSSARHDWATTRVSSMWRLCN